MEENKSKVYILIDKNNRVTRIEGGYTTPADLTDWILIDEGQGDRYNLAQNHYLEKPVRDYMTGNYNYKYINGEIVEV